MAERQSPAVSVIVRTLGRSERICDALESLARQSRDDFEVVVVDMSDGSIEPLIARCASRLRNLSHLKIGRPLTRPAALNVGIMAASAPLIAILDDDNLYDPGHLELLASGLEASAADYAYTGVRHLTFTTDGRQVASREVSIPFRFDRLVLGNYIYATSSLYRKALWERIGGYDERFEVYEDWDFIIRAAQAGKVVHIPVVSGESRKFTGLDGVSNFDLEIDSVRRCHAGIYWEHRKFFRGKMRHELKRFWADRCRMRHPPRTGLLAWSIAGWRLEVGSDLLAWWRFNRAWSSRTPAASAPQPPGDSDRRK
jgi:glycosyltransferase involved in cell wall biosynthesis